MRYFGELPDAVVYALAPTTFAALCGLGVLIWHLNPPVIAAVAIAGLALLTAPLWVIQIILTICGVCVFRDWYEERRRAKPRG